MKQPIQILLFILFAIGVILVLLFSWKTNPNVGEYSFLPNWLIDWADRYSNNQIRTAIPFIGLGILSGVFLEYPKKAPLYFRFWVWCLLVLLVGIAELGQYFIPTRHPDSKDFVWGILGAGIGLFSVFAGVKTYLNLKK